MPATTDRATRWKNRLKKSPLFKRGSWHVIFYLGRGVSFGRWNPFKLEKPPFSKSNSSFKPITLPNASPKAPQGSPQISPPLPTNDSSHHVTKGSVLCAPKNNPLIPSHTLTQSQMLTMIALRNRAVNCPDPNKTYSLLAGLPPEILRSIFESSRDFNPNSDFAQALHHVAFGELDKVKKLLDKNPRLVLQSGTVKTRSGLIVRHKTLLECALGEGDPEMAAMIMPYFSKIPGGEEEKERQLERYRQVIEDIVNQKPYDGLEKLFEIIKKSSSKNVTEALKKNMDYPSDLRDALIEFRKAVTLTEITQPQMHYNYQTLIRALEIYDREWDNLYKASGNNYNKCDLVWRQVIGYLQRGLPAVDRFGFARGLYDLVENKKPLERTTQYKYSNGSFPDISNVDPDFSGLGFDYGIYGARRGAGAGASVGAGCVLFYKTYVKQKHRSCRAYATASKTDRRRARDWLKW